jgi:hypothetical protein
MCLLSSVLNLPLSLVWVDISRWNLACILLAFLPITHLQKIYLGNGYSVREVDGDIGESRDSDIGERLSTECLGAEEAMIKVISQIQIRRDLFDCATSDLPTAAQSILANQESRAS